MNRKNAFVRTLKSTPILPKIYDRCQHCFLLVLVLALTSTCSGVEEEKERVVYSVDNLASELAELTFEFSGIFDLPDYMGPYFLEPLQEGDYIAANDRMEQKIHLFDKSGTYLSSAGGEGRGPGEFMGSIILHAGSNQYLYALDSRLSRITRFSIQQGKLMYDTTYPANLEPGSWWHNIYVTQWGNFGVIRSIVDYTNGEEVYHLYRLNDSFNKSQRLLEMPGNEKITLSEWSHIDHMAGRKTLWDLDGEWFYYITSNSARINRYNLRTGESKIDSWFELEKRGVTPEIRNHLMEFASNMILRFPDVRNVIDTVKVLPLFQEFMVQDKNIHFVVFNIEGSERTELIKIKQSTGDIHYADIPLRLRRIQAANDLLYGIENVEDGDEVIRIIKQEDDSN